MKQLSGLVFAVFLLSSAHAVFGQIPLEEVPGSGQDQFSPKLEAFSPFSHIPALQPLKKAALTPFLCAPFLYYQNSPSATKYYHTESVPTSQWAAKLTLSTTQAKRCTVWTVLINFELLNASAQSKDTIRIFVRSGSAPYTQIFSTWFIARPGMNQGLYEIDPPLVPPFNIRSIIYNNGNPLPDIMVGYQVVGDPSHSVKWEFTTPSLFTFPPRSYRFLTPTSIQPASLAVGTSVDWVFKAMLCCDFPIPVEMSVFDAQVLRSAVQLHWRTESETNNYHFEVLRSRNLEGPWESRGFVPGHGTTTEPQEYSYVDGFSLNAFAPGEAPVYWYRLRQTDFDGTANQTPPIQVQLTDLENSGFALSSVYPNPVSYTSDSYAVVRYQVPRESNVSVVVYDALGRNVATLADYTHQAGVYETAWFPRSSGETLQSGAYFIRMQSGSWSTVQKVALVR